MKLKFKHNPCEEHIDVETGDDWCPYCLMEEREKYRKALTRIANSVKDGELYTTGGHSDCQFIAKEALGMQNNEQDSN